MNMHQQNKVINKSNQKENKEKFIRYNWKIKAKQCRVIEENKQPIIMETKAAIEYAQEKDLDLVEVGYDYKTGISTAKICDYGKYIYELKRKEKLAKKQARANITEIKCLQIHLTTDTADLERIINQAKSFLENGNKVKLALRFRGRRELSNMDYAKDIMKKLLAHFEGLAILDSQPILNGKELSCVIRKI
jgi:translation initiation factor IF-3